jgi:hypothetical protein
MSFPAEAVPETVEEDPAVRAVPEDRAVPENRAVPAAARIAPFWRMPFTWHPMK